MSGSELRRVGDSGDIAPTRLTSFADLPTKGEVSELIMLSRLNQRATIQAQTLTADGGGGYSGAWTTLATVWAAVAPISGADVFGPDADESRARYRVTIKRRTDVFAGMRVAASGRVFAIRGVLDDGPQSQFLTLLTEDIG